MDGGSVAQKPAGASIPRAVREALAYWGVFINQCICKRLETDRFESFARLAYMKHPLPAAAIADLFLRPRPNNDESLDPRIPPYLQVLNNLEYTDAPSTFRALYKYSSSHALVERQQLPPNGEEENKAKDGADGEGKGSGEGESKENSDKPLRWRNSYWAEDHIFYAITRSIVEGRAVRDSTTALEVVEILSKWMGLFTAASAAFATDLLGEMQSAQVEFESSRAGLVAVLMCLRDNPALLHAIARPIAKGIPHPRMSRQYPEYAFTDLRLIAARKDLAENLSNFVPTLHLGNSITERGIFEKLENFRTVTLASLDPIDEKKQAADAAISEIIDSAVGGLESFVIDDIPFTNTRAGLYIYVSALLVGRPLVDDATLFSYLTNRYQGNIQAAAIDLILAAFDVLANAVFRNSGKEDAQLLRSFLINKVPLLLCQLFAPGFATASAEVCITQALAQVDTSLFPTASLMFDESRNNNNNPYTESAREEFCAACVLHGLVEREHVERILGEMSLGYEPKKYSKDDLVRDYLSQTDKISGVVADLDKMDGNVGAVCQAIVEVIRQLCSGKETMSLKSLCIELVQKPQALDILLLFERVPTILAPICQLLDKWHYEEDQAEYQPVYEEFGGILLLVFTFVNRYNLSPADLGLYSANSSVRKILSRSHMNYDMEGLSDQEKQHLGGWIQGLFGSEAGGLGDELMSSCPPQNFYLIVAPLFCNIVIGYAHGHLTDESLKSGVEFFVEPFLLPSLVPAIKFLADYLWIDQKEQKAVLKVLQLFLLPNAISTEASSMLASVKKIIATPLEHALRTYQRRDPQNQEINPLLSAIKESILISRRTGLAENNELEQWAQAPPSGFWSSIKTTTQGLVQWSAQWSLQPNIMPTTYTHRQIIAGIKMMSAQRVLSAIIDEVKTATEDTRAQSPRGNIQPGDVRVQAAYDVATALICAPNVTNEPSAPSVENLGDEPQPVIPTLQRALTLRDALRLEAQGFKATQKKDPILAEIIVRLHRKVEAQMQINLPPAPPMLPAPDMTLDMSAAPEVSLNDAMAAMQNDVGGAGLDMSGIDGLGGPSSVGVGDPNGDGDLFGIDSTSLDDFDWGSTMELG
ncbi:unnamed protein product [Clonostachys chloroleuca]|uniref:Mediator of RNA polymerase II transcription subunit 5 n=1 Tax=Clonostachys chloroleuca TaxID=1926264 RepID=A0AA35QEA8_9HYPO|nr:unnamed protein product [Clonostachys chloroleuca]